jgi:ubiquinone biosynthesis protein
MGRSDLLETPPAATPAPRLAPPEHPAVRVRHRTTLGRAVQIAEILARQELWHLIEILDLTQLVGWHNRHHDQRRDAPAHEQPVRLRLALAELGPTFMKLGQMLSLRGDLLPPAYQRELAKLQDAAPTLPIAAVREVIAADLGRPPEELFATFEATPLAAASIGQVHLATLHDGTEVVVKVRRPGADEQIAEDLKLLHRLAVTAERRWAAARQYDVVGLVEAFERALNEELDYQREGRNAERFARNFAGSTAIRIPRVFWDTSTARVLTMERMAGCKITDSAALDALGQDRALLAQRGVGLVLKMIFEDGFFHADLHPGNLFVEESGRIAVIDFGMVGTIDRRTRAILGHLLLAVAGRDVEAVIDAILELDSARAPIDRGGLARELGALFARLEGQSLVEVTIAPLLADLLDVARRYELTLPSELMLLVKAVAMAESIGEHLDPGFGFMAALAPYARRIVLAEYGPRALAARLAREGPDLAWFATELPGHLRRLIGAVEAGAITLAVQPTGMDPLLDRFERATGRLMLAIIVAALAIALAILTATYHLANPIGALGTLIDVGTGLLLALALLLWWKAARESRR